jgi:hypothetical protein
MVDDLHLLAQGLSLLSALKHLRFSFLPSVLQGDILKLLEGKGSDQACDIIEPHAYSPVAQDVKDAILGVLFKMAHPHPTCPFASFFPHVGTHFLPGEHGGSGDSTGN